MCFFVGNWNARIPTENNGRKDPQRSEPKSCSGDIFLGFFMVLPGASTTFVGQSSTKINILVFSLCFATLGHFFFKSCSCRLKETRYMVFFKQSKPPKTGSKVGAIEMRFLVLFVRILTFFQNRSSKLLDLNEPVGRGQTTPCGITTSWARSTIPPWSTAFASLGDIGKSPKPVPTLFFRCSPQKQRWFGTCTPVSRCLN